MSIFSPPTSRSNEASPPSGNLFFPNQSTSPPLMDKSPKRRLMLREDLIAESSTRSVSPNPPPPIMPSLHHSPASLEHLRLQQLYTLAFADRMRFLHNPMLAAAAASHQMMPSTTSAPPSLLHSAPQASQAAMAHLSQLAAAAMAAASGPNCNQSTPPRLAPPAPPPPPLPPAPKPPRMSSSVQHTANPPTISDFPQTHPLAAYYGKFDPRLFRMSDEPKPQHSYIGLISMAILSCPEMKLVLADIYQYILDNYPYFRHRGPGWRNSIRHNLSLNDCFIKAGRAANGKGHYWAIHPACTEDFKRGDYRRRKAQRKVRKHMGLAVDDEDSPSPPPPPFAPPGTILPLGWPTVTPAGVRIPPPIIPHPLHPHQPHAVPHHPLPLPASFYRQNPHMLKDRQDDMEHRICGDDQAPSPPAISPEIPADKTKTKPGKRLFDVASLLGGDHIEKRTKFDDDFDDDMDDNQRIVKEIFERKRSKLCEEDNKKPEPIEHTPVLDEEDKHEEEANQSNNNVSESPVRDDDEPREPHELKISPGFSPHEYLARYYHLMQQQQAAAALSAAAAASSDQSREHSPSPSDDRQPSPLVDKP